VIHVHHLNCGSLKSLPATRDIEYGTRNGERNSAIVNEQNFPTQNFSMAGHRGGIVCFGKRLRRRGIVVE